jgi:hypothetical protein
MPDDTTIAAALTELDSIANAAMTSEQRVTRAQPIFGAALSLQDVLQALGRGDLSWNKSKAAEYSVSKEQWQQALELGGIAGSPDLSAFLKALHRAESAAAMLRAGYKASKGPTGAIAWIR